MLDKNYPIEGREAAGAVEVGLFHKMVTVTFWGKQADRAGIVLLLFIIAGLSWQLYKK